MSSIVLDCSIAVSWCFEDEASEKADLYLEMIRDKGAWVPNLWHLEITNVLLQAAKRGRIGYPSIQERLDLLAILPIKTDDQTSSRAFSDIVLLAEETGLTSYDTSYLELAIRRKLFLATNDKALQKAAKEVGVAILK